MVSWKSTRICLAIWLLTGQPAGVAQEPAESPVDVPAAVDPGRQELPQVARINAAIRHSWRANQLEPSAPASDSEFLRRLYLDVLGRIPTVDELADDLADKRPDRKQRWVQRLIYEDLYAVDFANHWATIWANVLVGRPAEDDRNSLVNRAGLEKFLRDSFAANQPYDRLVHQLVSAQGANRPGTADFNGAVNFLAGKLADGATQATAHTSKVFLGLQVQCTQCHNHPFNEWKQDQFWQLNSFFRQAAVLRRYKPGTRDVQYVELTNQDFAGEDQPMDPQNARIYYELRNGKLEAAFPVFIDGTRIETSGYIQDVNRRGELAALIIHSPYLSRAIVNRTWAHFLGYGFTRPIDDMGPHNPAVEPELLEYLAEQLRENSYDLRQLMTWIVLSEPYGLSSRTTRRNAADDPSAGHPPRFSHFYLRQMTAEQLYRSLLIASQADQTQGTLAKQQAAQRDWLRQFTIAFGTDEGDETTTFDGTITQTLMMFNGELIERATQGSAGSFLDRIARDPQLRSSAKVQQLFLAAVARPPDGRELKGYQQLLIFHQQNELLALQDLWWALLNSNEFILNH